VCPRLLRPRAGWVRLRASLARSPGGAPRDLLTGMHALPCYPHHPAKTHAGPKFLGGGVRGETSFRQGGCRSVAGVQPGLQHSDHIIEAVTSADRDESLTAADSAGASQGLERGEGKLRLRERQPGLGA
jgi:hypothetical protein